MIISDVNCAIKFFVVFFSIERKTEEKKKFCLYMFLYAEQISHFQVDDKITQTGMLS